MKQERDEKILTLPVGQHDHIRGTPSAPVTLVVYGDYECRHSAEAYSVIKENRQHFGSRLRFVFRHFPISQVHTQAQHAAEAAEAAGAQNKFWEMHDMMFEHQQALENGFLVEYANTLGLDISQFLRHMSQHTHADRVHEDFLSGMQSGVNATPTFFINGVRHDTPWGLETLLAAMEEVVSS